MEKALVLLNPLARGGRGKELWEIARPEVEKIYSMDIALPDEAETGILTAINAGTRTFIAAGGDGTVNLLLNHLAALKGTIPLEQFALGAVGLGSSNDFHKPFGRKIGSIPLLLGAPGEKGVGAARFQTPTGERTRLFIVSAGMGIVAEANGFFNRGNKAIETLKRFWTDGAIVYAALRTLFSYQNRQASLIDGKGERTVSLTNLSVLRTPFLSGFFRYDTPVEPSFLSVNLCEGMSRCEAIITLIDLARGRFQGKKKRSSFQSEEISLRFPAAVTLELDGEIEETTSVTFSLHPERIKVCRST